MKATRIYSKGYHSIFGPFIMEYIRMKQDGGIGFVHGSWDMARFDQYCQQKELVEPVLTKQFINDWLESIEIYPPVSRCGTRCVVRGFSLYLNTLNPGSTIVPNEAEGAYICKSFLAPAIGELIAAKRKEGKAFKGETFALKSFDRYCLEHQVGTPEDITPKIIHDWHISRFTAPHAKDYRYTVRQLCIYLRTAKGWSVAIPPTRLKEAHPAENFQFRSIFASLLDSFVDDKRASGYKYDSERKILKYFDLMCSDREEPEPRLNKDLILQWMIQRPTESIGYRNKRVSIIRQFSLFLASRGYGTTLIPQAKGTTVEKPHIFHQEEVEAFFDALDKQVLNSTYMRLTAPVIFRFYYCLGLRLNEPIDLQSKDIDLSSGTVTLRKAKCLKDRVLTMPEDLRELALLYDRELRHTVPDRTYFFISDVLGAKVSDTGLCRIFNRAWEGTGYAQDVDKKPTIHCFRHTAVVRKLEQWYEQQVDYEYWLPYLSAFLGHSKLEETYLYVHLVDSAFPQIRHSMKTFEKLYPEVGHGQTE